MTEHEWVEGDDVEARRTFIAELYPTRTVTDLKEDLRSRGYSYRAISKDIAVLVKEGRIKRKGPGGYHNPRWESLHRDIKALYSEGVSPGWIAKRTGRSQSCINLHLRSLRENGEIPRRRRLH